MSSLAANKRNSVFQTGMDKMRNEAPVLDTCQSLVNDMANLVAQNVDNAFDLLYVNMPWKHVSMDYAMNLSLENLVKGKTHAGMLLWVDSPHVSNAHVLLDKWGFTFHSVLHVTSYTNPLPSSNATPVDSATPVASIDTSDPAPVAAAAVAAQAQAPVAAAVAAAPPKPLSLPPSPPKPRRRRRRRRTAQAPVAATVAAAQAPAAVAAAVRKNLVPHGWDVDGLVPSRSRQLWFATRNTNGNATPYLKDASFIRKRIAATSTFEYSKTTELTMANLSSKKKNLDNWLVYPDYEAYVPVDLCMALETIPKPNARVLSLFGDKISRQWYTWGPNIPGYVSCPLRVDGDFPVVNALLKYFSSMKGATVQKYLTLMNLYAVQYAKQLGNAENPEMDDDGNPKQHLTPFVTGRMNDFFTDLLRRYQETGGSPTNTWIAPKFTLENLKNFVDLTPDIQTQILLLVAQVIRRVLEKNALATERRKKAIKRKRDVLTTDSEPTARVPRKFGIAAPVDVSPDLSKFMGLPPGEKVARTTVVKYINEYIGKNNLQNPEKKSEIKFDDTLQQLLNPSPAFGAVTYFNLCKLLGPHFISTKAGGNPPPSSPLPALQDPLAARPQSLPTRAEA